MKKKSFTNFKSESLARGQLNEVEEIEKLLVQEIRTRVRNLKPDTFSKQKVKVK